ncbi:hypothetical protein PM082_021802 [Marasmius tenuissimus]|nr:hypothetical protein PM082_021802 [Marasmius tenuissimus]
MTWTLERRDSSHPAAKSAPRPDKPKPLSFDRANQGRPTNSPFPVFVKLPVELYHSVTSHISNVDLEALALVDRDCRQLARSVQFVDVTLDFNPCSMGFLEKLLVELAEDAVAEKENSAGETREDTEHPRARAISNRIGPCVRRIKVTEIGPGILSSEVENYERMFPVLFKQGVSTYEEMQECYFMTLYRILERGLPNLSELEWSTRGMKSTMGVTLDCLQVTAARPTDVAIRHLVLDLGYFSPRVPLFGLGVSCWSLETLVLNVHSTSEPVTADWVVEERGCSCFAADLLRCVAGSLRSLVWKDARGHQHSFGAVAPSFVKLREVTLDGIWMKDSTVLDAFLGAKTRVSSLKVDLESKTTRNFLAKRGHIESLEKFHWAAGGGSTPTAAVEEATTSLLPFICANQHMRTLSGSSPMSPQFIEGQLLPMITSPPNALTRLTSVHIVWDARSIPESALTAIGSLTSLKRLWLSAGTQHGWRTDWAIDHKLIAKSLNPLQNLETLVLTRDSYEVRGHPLLDCSIERYYVNRNLPQNVVFAEYLLNDEIALLNRFFGLTADRTMPLEQARALHSKLLKAAWERWHQCRMVDVVRDVYVDVLGGLESCFVGQYWIRVHRLNVAKQGQADEEDEEVEIFPEHTIRCGSDEVNGWWQTW